MSTERRLRQFWTQEIECGVAAGKLDRVGRGTVTLHSSTAADDERGAGAHAMIALRTQHALKHVAENPGVSVGELAARYGVSCSTITRARRAAGA